MKDTKDTSTNTPPWALEPFRAYLDHHKRWMRLIDLIEQGMRFFPELPELAEVLARRSKTEALPETVRQLEHARHLAKFAQEEIDEGIPLLHGHAVAGLWGSLEIAVRTFVARWLKHQKGAMSLEAVQKLRVKVGDYESFQGDDRFFYIVDRLEQEISATLKSGAQRFESLLELIGFGGPIPEDMRKGLFELSHFRNAMMHRMGIVDRQRSEACPWLDLKVGSRIPFNRETTEKYARFAIEYVRLLLVRMDRISW